MKPHKEKPCAARSIPASHPRKVSSRSSTRCMPSARPVRPHPQPAGRRLALRKTPYDDGGLSGATMERPALRQLLADIEEGLVDVVVVYKVDRLTRSLSDFARMVEIFDATRSPSSRSPSSSTPRLRWVA